MALTAVLIGIGVAGGVGASKLMAPKVTVPDQPPAPITAAAPPLAPVIPKLAPADNAGDAAAKRQRRAVKGAVGRGDTLLTGPKGLGELPAVNTQVKTLLGY